MHIFLYIFAVASIVHVTAIFLRKEKLRKISKVFIIPPLLAAYITGAENQLLFVIPALVLGWIGDVLLLRIRNRVYFQLGLVSFLLGHICYIITFIECLGLFGSGGAGRLNMAAIVVMVPLAIIGGGAAFRFVKPSKDMIFPVLLYMIVIEIMLLFSLEVLLSYRSFAGILIFSGALCFLVSDTILAYFTFRKLKRLGAVLIMVFYILAQTGIVLGLLRLTPYP